MEIAAIVLALIGISATAFVGRLVHTKTSKLLKRINSILIARIPPEELSAIIRLIEDIEKTGEKRGTISEKPNGKWAIDWTPLNTTKL